MKPVQLADTPYADSECEQAISLAQLDTKHGLYTKHAMNNITVASLISFQDSISVTRLVTLVIHLLVFVVNHRQFSMVLVMHDLMQQEPADSEMQEST